MFCFFRNWKKCTSFIILCLKEKLSFKVQVLYLSFLNRFCLLPKAVISHFTPPTWIPPHLFLIIAASCLGQIAVCSGNCKGLGWWRSPATKSAAVSGHTSIQHRPFSAKTLGRESLSSFIAFWFLCTARLCAGKLLYFWVDQSGTSVYGSCVVFSSPFQGCCYKACVIPRIKQTHQVENWQINAAWPWLVLFYSYCWKKMWEMLRILCDKEKKFQWELEGCCVQILVWGLQNVKWLCLPYL